LYLIPVLIACLALAQKRSGCPTEGGRMPEANHGEWRPAIFALLRTYACRGYSCRADKRATLQYGSLDASPVGMINELQRLGPFIKPNTIRIENTANGAVASLFSHHRS